MRRTFDNGVARRCRNVLSALLYRWITWLRFARLKWPCQMRERVVHPIDMGLLFAHEFGRQRAHGGIVRRGSHFLKKRLGLFFRAQGDL